MLMELLRLSVKQLRYIAAGKFQCIEPQPPTDFWKSAWVILCLLQCNYVLSDSRGRLSLQEKINFLMRSPLCPCFFFFRLKFNDSELLRFAETDCFALRWYWALIFFTRKMGFRIPSPLAKSVMNTHIKKLWKHWSLQSFFLSQVYFVPNNLSPASPSPGRI